MASDRTPKLVHRATWSSMRDFRGLTIKAIWLISGSICKPRFQNMDHGKPTMVNLAPVIRNDTYLARYVSRNTRYIWYMLYFFNYLKYSNSNLRIIDYILQKRYVLRYLSLAVFTKSHRPIRHCCDFAKCLMICSKSSDIFSVIIWKTFH